MHWAVNAGPDKSLFRDSAVVGSGSVTYSEPYKHIELLYLLKPGCFAANDNNIHSFCECPGGCVAIDSAMVTVFQHFDCMPDLTTICFAMLFSYMQRGMSYSWQPSVSLSNPGIANPAASRQSTTITWAHWCQAVLNRFCSVKIFPLANPVSVTPHDTTICLGPGWLHASDAETYSCNHSRICRITCPVQLPSPVKSTYR
jgi:hypothetical protein